MSTRSLGLIGMLGALALTIVEVRYGVIAGQSVDPAALDRFDELMYAVWGIGLACSFWAIYRLSVTGTNPLMRVVPLLGGVGGMAMTVGSLLDVAGLARPDTNPLFSVAWPGILLGALLTGILALVARTWTGWRKFAPLIAVLTMLVVIGLSSVFGSAVEILFGLGWLILGYAVFSSNPQPALHTAPLNVG